MAGEGGLANEVRTGLGADVMEFSPVNSGIESPLTELYFGKPVGDHVREFGALMALVLLIIGAVKGHRHDSLYELGIFSLIGSNDRFKNTFILPQPPVLQYRGLFFGFGFGTPEKQKTQKQRKNKQKNHYANTNDNKATAMAFVICWRSRLTF